MPPRRGRPTPRARTSPTWPAWVRSPHVGYARTAPVSKPQPSTSKTTANTPRMPPRHRARGGLPRRRHRQPQHGPCALVPHHGRRGVRPHALLGPRPEAKGCHNHPNPPGPNHRSQANTARATTRARAPAPTSTSPRPSSSPSSPAAPSPRAGSSASAPPSSAARGPPPASSSPRSTIPC